jgi:hypothetical protein
VSWELGYQDEQPEFTRKMYGTTARAREKRKSWTTKSNGDSYCVIQFRDLASWEALSDKPNDWEGWCGPPECHEGYTPADWEAKMPSDWYAGDTPSWAQLQEEWRVGYMAEEIEKMSSGLRAKAEGLIVSRKRKRRRHHEGGELSSDRWINGDYHTPYIGKLGSLLCHPASFRFRQFRLIKALPLVDSGANLGRSMPLDTIPKPMYRKIVDTLPGNTIVLDSVYSEDTALQAVAKALENIKNPTLVG